MRRLHSHCDVRPPAGSGGSGFAGEIIDAVIATVSRQPVLQSEWDDATRFEAFMQQKPLATVSDRDRVRALQRLIDRRLLEVQMNNPHLVRAIADELRATVAKLRAQIPAAKDDAGWQAVLAEYGFTSARSRTTCGARRR